MSRQPSWRGLRRWPGIVGSVLLVVIVLGWLSFRTGVIRHEAGDSFGATVSLGPSRNDTDVVGVEQQYALEDQDRSFRYQAVVPDSRELNLVWRAPTGDGRIEVVVTQQEHVIASLVLTEAGCRKLRLPEAGPMEVEIRAHAPAAGSVELAWDEEQRCG